MEKYILKYDLKVMGIQVKSFPEGIGATFDTLAEALGGFNRSFYGVCYMDAGGKLIYKACAEELHEDEAEKYNCERLKIEKGEYLTVTLKDWLTKTGSINGIFHKMMGDHRVDKTKPCVEWYKNDNEMVCMVKAKM